VVSYLLAILLYLRPIVILDTVYAYLASVDKRKAVDVIYSTVKRKEELLGGRRTGRSLELDPLKPRAKP